MSQYKKNQVLNYLVDCGGFDEEDFEDFSLRRLEQFIRDCEYLSIKEFNQYRK